MQQGCPQYILRFGQPTQVVEQNSAAQLSKLDLAKQINGPVWSIAITKIDKEVNARRSYVIKFARSDNPQGDIGIFLLKLRDMCAEPKRCEAGRATDS